MKKMEYPQEKFKAVYKLFFAWQEEECEKWLNSMSMDGWHLVGVKYYPAIKFYFLKGEPTNYIYKFDVKSMFTRKIEEEYLEIYENAGWEYVTQDVLTTYFRKEYTPGEENEIYTDNGSRIGKYKSILTVLYGTLLLEFICLLVELAALGIAIAQGNGSYKLYLFFTGIIIAFICVVFFGISKIRWKIKGLKGPLE